MKFLRFLCNFLMFLAVTFGISVVQVGLFDVVAAQSDDVKAIHVVAPTDESVAYLDSYTFWAEDIGCNLKQDAKYRVRNWGQDDWWKKGMAWADIAIDAAIAVVKPVVVPVAQINSIMVYYGYGINQFNDSIVTSYGHDYKKANDALYQLYEVFGKGYGECHEILPGVTVDEGGKIVTHYYSSDNLISSWADEYNERLAADLVSYSSKDEAFYKGEVEVENTYCQFSRWCSKNKVLYNHNWKLQKYNLKTYDKYFKKFIKYDVVYDGDEIIGYANRTIKPATVVLYYQQYVAIIIAIIFVLKFPINFAQGRYVGNDMGIKKNKKREE